MPKMVYLKGVGFVRAGSWSTKDPYDRWRLIDKQLEDADDVLVRRLERMLFDATDPYSRVRQEYFDSELGRVRLEGLRDQIDALLRRLDRERKADALENTAGRTPEEAELYRQKARELRAG